MKFICKQVLDHQEHTNDFVSGEICNKNGDSERVAHLREHSRWKCPKLLTCDHSNDGDEHVRGDGNQGQRGNGGLVKDHAIVTKSSKRHVVDMKWSDRTASLEISVMKSAPRKRKDKEETHEPTCH